MSESCEFRFENSLNFLYYNFKSRKICLYVMNNKAEFRTERMRINICWEN